MRFGVGFITFSLLFVLSCMPADAGVVNVDIYRGFDNSSPSGTPYSDLAGSFTSSGVSFATDTGYDWHPFGLNAFGALITGVLDVASDGTYNLTLDSDDGSLLFIDGNLAIDNGGGHGPTQVTEAIMLSAGSHSFRVEFYEDFGGQSGVDLLLPTGVTFGGTAVVPEPASAVVLLGSCAGLFGWRLRRRNVAA